MRAQLNLPSLGVALLLVTAAVGLSLTVAQGAFAGAEREPVRSHAANALADRLVAADGPLAKRENVLDAAELDALNASQLRAAFPVVGNRTVAVRLDDRTLARTGAVSNPTTVRRVVLVANTTTRTLAPALSTGELTIPRRTGQVTVRIDPPTGTTVRAVRVNDRTVLLNDSGLRGAFSIRTSRWASTTLAFDANGALPAGSVRVTYQVERTTKGVLVVAVDG